MNNDELVSKIDALMKELQIPGAAIGFYSKDGRFTNGFGVTNIEHPLPVDEKTLFQIGSITKTFVGTMAMMLVEQGKLDLDKPIISYLPSFEVQDKGVSAKVTMHHLFTHTAGWVGDWFPSGIEPGSDSVEQYVNTMKDDPQITPFAELISYNNAGYNLAGRVLEAITGRVFSDLIKEMIFEPLEMSHTYILPWEVMTHRYASGHNHTEDGVEVATPWFIGRASGPAGGIITCVKDMLNYIKFHLSNGIYNGIRLLSEESLETLHTPQIYFTPHHSIAMTFWVDESRRTRTLGHGGGTVGQISLLTLVPEYNFGMILVTNSYKGRILNPEVTNLALKHYIDVETPEYSILDLGEAKLNEYAGDYEAKLTAVKVAVKEGNLTLSQRHLGGFPTEDVKTESTEPSRPQVYGFYEKDHIIGLERENRHTLAQFVRDTNGEIKWLRSGSRLHKRL